MLNTALARCVASCVVVACLAVPARAEDQSFEVSYPASTEPGELTFAVKHVLWIPDGVKTVRAVIVHQHGCGAGACLGGETAAQDLHWQALARKWDAALLGPRYYQEDKQNCRLWCDPRNGSGKTFLKALDELAAKSKHPEVAAAPWCLWGHSGGAFWASLMQAQHPERIVAIWFRSGTAFAAWEKGEIPKPEIPDAAYRIPMMLNPGAKENGDPRFSGAWTGSTAMFEAYRKRGATIGFAPDPHSAHDCGDSRYLAIPFFDACLEHRLPVVADAPPATDKSTGDKATGDKATGDKPPKPTLRAMPETAWLAPLLGDKAVPADQYEDDRAAAVWLPDARVAKAWSEYVTTGFVADTSPPPAPTDLKATARDGAVALTWTARADFESGLSGFVVRRDGKDLAALPEKPAARFGRALFQRKSYHDTPEQPLPEMTYVDRAAVAGQKHVYEVIARNAAELKSRPSKPASP